MQVWRSALRVMAIAAVLGIAACGPKSDKDLIASAKNLIEKKDNAAAVVQLKRALQQQPELPQARYLLGATLLASGDAGAAVVELEKARQLKYSDDEVLPKLARALVLVGQTKKVTDQYEQVALSNPHAMAELSTAVAQAFADQGQGDRSAAAAVRALQADPKNSGARLLDARLKAGRGQIKEALTALDALIADEPRNRDAWYFKGELLLRAKRADEAAPAFKQTLAIDPKFLLAHDALVGMLLQRRELVEFKAQVQKMSEALPAHPDTRYFQAQAALLDKDFVKARGVAQQLLRDFPETPRLLQLAGTIDLMGGSVTTAEGHLAKAVRLQPRSVPARRLLAQAYLRGDQPARALAILQPVLESEPDAEALALAAEAYLQNGQLGESEALLIKAAKINPDDLRVRTAMVLAKIAKGDAEAGMAEMERLAASAQSSYTDIALISARIRRNDLANALKDVDRLQAKLPNSALTHQLRGRILAQMNDAAAARASFEKAVAIDPSYVPAIASLSVLDVADKHTDVAIKRFESLLAREPGNYRAVLALAELRQQTGATPEQTRQLLVDAIKASPAEAEPRVKLVDYLLARWDIRGARNAAQEAVAALPEDPRALDALGRTELAAGDVQQAINSFTKAVALQPASAAAHFVLAQAQASNKDAASARRSLLRVLEIDPHSLQAQTALIQLLIAQKRPDEALSVARTAQKQRPTAAAGHLLEADVYVSQQRWESAIAALRAAMDREKTVAVATRMHATLVSAGKLAEADQLAEKWLGDNAKDITFLSYLGASAMDRRLFAQSESRYRAVLALDEKNVNALNNVAWSMTQQGKKGALPFAEKANKLSPDQPGLMDTLAEALAAEGDFDQAVEWQRKALARSGDNPGYRLHLAKLLIAKGDRASARTELVALAKLGTKFSGRAEAVKLLQTL